MPIDEPEASIEEELAWTKATMLAEEEAKARPAKKVVPHVKFFDAYMCFQRGEWEGISEELRRRYVMILRRAANARTFSTDEVRKNALAVLEALGLPAESEKNQKAARKEPLTEKEKENIARSRRKLVDRQKRIIVEKIERNEMTTQMHCLVDPGPYQEQAVAELVREDKILIILDEMIQIERGRPPYDGSPRRSKRVVRLGFPMNHAGDLSKLEPSEDDDLI